MGGNWNEKMAKTSKKEKRNQQKYLTGEHVMRNLGCGHWKFFPKGKKRKGSGGENRNATRKGRGFLSRVGVGEGKRKFNLNG